MRIVDRRLNPGGKSFENRQRFLRRAKDMVERAVRDATRDRAIGDLEKPGEVTIPAEGTREPYFQHVRGNRRDVILPGNREYVEGDLIDRRRAARKAPARHGTEDNQEDAFRFVLTRTNFCAFFWMTWNCPISPSDEWSALKKRSAARRLHNDGNPANLSLDGRCGCRSRDASHWKARERRDRAIGAELAAASLSQDAAVDRLQNELDIARERRLHISYLDPVDCVIAASSVSRDRSRKPSCFA